MSPQVVATSKDIVTVSGPDAVTYLQGQLSQDVAGLAEGETTWTFVLAPQGKVEGWGRVHRLDDDRFSFVVDSGAGEAWGARLNRFLLRTKAEIEVTADVMVASIRGEGSEALLESLDGVLGAGWRASGWPGAEGFDRVSGADHRDVVENLVAGGATAVDHDGMEALRIRAGVPAWGAEIDEDTIPATLGQWVIDASVSFTKGCYTGQELVARIDSRGGNVPRSLHGVSVEGGVPAPGAPVLVSGDAGEITLGEVTSCAPHGTGAVGLLFVPRAHEVPAGGLEARVGDMPATVVTLPFGPST